MGKKRPSIKHKNRKAHNWLAYDILDKILLSPLFKEIIGENVYDLGAGQVPYRDYILKFAKYYTSIDWGQSLHDINVDIIADLNKELPIESEICDTVLSISVLEHLNEPQTMLNEAFRILKKGGSIFIQVPWQWWIHEGPYDFYRYTPFGLRYLLEKAGFEDIVIKAQAGFFTTVVLKFNYFTRRFVRGPFFLKLLIQIVLVPFWFIGQVIAPTLDKIDRNWNLETVGYIVLAKRPSK